MVTRSRAREGRGVSVKSEAPREPEIEMRPEPEILVPQASVTICEGGLRATGPSATETISLFTSEVIAAHTSKEVTASLFTAPSQTSTPHKIYSYMLLLHIHQQNIHKLPANRIK